uniref:Uncharacterized protein n=1 Tax=Ditylenchus dipsaci TaxID=166011 RepID=A0A915CX98_9BILA
MLPHIILLEPAQECMMSGLLGMCAVCYVFGWVWMPVFFLIHCFYWCVCDYILLYFMQNGPLPFSILQYLICWLYREGMIFPTFMMALLNPDIGWSVGTYRLCWGGRIQPRHSPSFSSSNHHSLSSTTVRKR